MKHLLSAGLFLLLAACTNVYFEKPVPQNGQPLLAPPPALQGAYEVLDDGTDKNEEPDLLAAWLKPCYFFEKLDHEQLLISEEIRFHERDLPQIKAHLARKKADGTLADYTLTGRGILYTTAADSSGQQTSGYAPMLKSGSWYILTRSQKPARMYSFSPKNAFEQVFDTKHGGDGDFLPEADSLDIKTATLVARQRAGAFFLNTQEADGEPESGWSLLWCVPDAQGDLLLKFSSLGYNGDSLIENNRARYEAITTFAKTSNDNYLINPDDQALDALLADPALFKTMRLRKLKE